ncbi:MAG TPA: glutathione S-transferase family protein [Conexibacter sp.]|nr:glutathione S-transferase family protein [Conexibacter sp.]
MAGTPVLWHIKLSHYSEKVRWALDCKRVQHRRRAPLPGVGTTPVALALTRRVTFPVLQLDGHAISDSTAIIAALEQRCPHPPLYPSEPAQRARALELEDFFDEQLAPYVRGLGFSHMTRDPKNFYASVLPDSSPLTRAVLLPGAFAITRIARARYPATHANEQQAARAKVLAAMDRIEAEVGPSGYLVGDAFSVADLAAAALSTPLLRPPGRPHLPSVAFPEPLQSFCDELARRPAAEWVSEIYRRHRGVSAEVRRGRARTSPRAAVSA